ncbi:MAG: NB-ARC domain-containing protein [Anaerolineae bacterium]
MTTLDLTFLGTFQVIRDGHPVTKFRSANVRGLLVYLALRGNRPAERDRLATLFWPEEPEGVAKTNVRQIIYHLRQALDDKTAETSFFVVDRRTVMLNPAAAVQVDVTRFMQAVEQGDLEAAGILYSGELLPGFLCDSPDFEGWLRHERDKHNRIALDVLSQLAERHLGKSDFAAAKSSALKQLSIEPWREMAHFQLMQAMALSGEREAAIAQFEQLEEILDTEMGISPQQETFDLIRQIENNELGGSLTRTTFEPATPYQAPAVPDYLVGREANLAMLEQLFTGDEPSAERKETVALVGMGGIGKTTLAAATARKLQEKFPDGILWGNALLSSAENILEVWAQAFGYDFSGISDLESLATAVRGILAEKKILIVLDNVTEQTNLKPLLQPGGNCATLLTTRSRDAAAAVGAHIVPVEELSEQNSVSLIGKILDRPDLSDQPEEEQAARQIGHLLEHLPLAVEITAQLLKARPRLTLSRMVERLQDSQQRRGLKISNKAVRASFELSWEFLTPELQTLFANIGVFEGRSFTFDALQAVCDTDRFDTEDDLYSLVSRSLVQLDGEDRYKQHPLLADFAAEKLQATGNTSVLTRLIDFYLGYSKANALNFEALQPEWDNLLAMAHSVSELGDGEKLLELTDVLHESWFRYGRYADANEIYALAETAAKKLGSQEQLVKTLIRWSEMGLEQSDYDRVWSRLETALPIAYQLEDDSAVGQVKYLQGYVLFDQGEYAKAADAVKQSIQLFESQEDMFNLAKGQDLLGWIFYEADEDIEKAYNAAGKALTFFQQAGEVTEKISTLRLLATIAFQRKAFDDAEKLAKQALVDAKNANSLSEEVACSYLLTGTFRAMQKFKDAEKIGTEGLILAQQIGLIRWEGMIRQELSTVSLNLGDLEQSQKHTEAILKIYKLIEDRLGYGYALRQMGDIYKELGEHAKSRHFWSEAKDIAHFLNHAKLLAQLEERLLAT